MVIQDHSQPRVLLAFGGPEVDPWALAKKLRLRGLWVDNYDKELSECPNDLMDDTIFEPLLARCRSGYYVGGIIAPPCGVRSRARNAQPGPPVLATREFPYGLPGLSAAQQLQVSVASELLFRALRIETAMKQGNAWSFLEQPEDFGDHPSAWDLDAVQKGGRLIGAVSVSFDQYPWGGLSSKPTTVRGTLAGISFLGLRGPKVSNTDAGRLIGKASAHYPPGMNDILCDLIIADLVNTEKCELTPTDIGWKKESAAELQYFMHKDQDEQWCAKHVRASGPPIIVHTGAKWRPFADGGGLASPGRWLPSHRGPPKLQKLITPLNNVVRTLCSGDCLKLGAMNAFTPCPGDKKCWRPGCSASKPCGEESPWAVTPAVSAAHEALQNCLPQINWHAAKGQPYAGDAISVLLHECGDPEAAWFKEQCDRGVDMGCAAPMPRTPHVCRLKSRWRLKPWHGELVSATTNYSSTQGHEGKIAQKLEGERDLGRVLGPFKSKEAAAAACQCAPEEVIVGKCAFLADKGERTIFDDSITGVNPSIRCDDAIEWPGMPEAECLMKNEQAGCAQSMTTIHTRQGRLSSSSTSKVHIERHDDNRSVGNGW